MGFDTSPSARLGRVRRVALLRSWSVTAADAELLAGLVVGLFALLWIDLHFFARGREPSFREAVWWSVGWLAVSLLAAIPVLLLEGRDDAVV